MFWIKLPPSLPFILKNMKISIKISTWHIFGVIQKVRNG